MKIIKLHIEDFGCFFDRTFDFSDGINLIEGENESGKSTLISFIKFILYGMPKKKTENAPFRDRSISWKSGTAAGSMTIESNGKEYRINRRGSVDAKGLFTDVCTIVELRTGVEILKGKCPGEHFLGVTQSVFESTCFVRQLGSGDIDKEDVARALENMLVSADEGLNLKKALDKLEDARKLFRHKKGNGGSLSGLEAEETSLKTRLAKAMDDYNKILSRTDAVAEMKTVISQKRSELDRLEDTAAALAMVGVVKRFDLLRSTESELNEARESLEDVRSRSIAAYGSLPTENHVFALKEADAAQKNAQNLLDAAETSYENSKEATEKFRAELCGAFTEELRLVTDPKSVCDEIKRLAAAHDRSRALLKVSFIASAVTLVASIVSFLVFFPVGIALAIITACALALGIASNSKAKRIRNAIDNALSGYGATGGDIKSRLDTLRVLFKQYADGTRALSERERALSLSESARDMRRADLETCIASTDVLMEKWNGGKDDPAEAIEVARELLSEISRLEGEIRRLSFSASALTAELSEYDEKDVRARVPSHIVEKFTPKDIERAENERKFVSMSLKQLSEKCTATEKELIALEKDTENPNRLSFELDKVKERIASESFTLEAIVLAYDSLNEASSNIRSTVTPLIRSRASELMAILTGDKYSSIGIDDGYNLFAESNDGIRSVSLLSAGTQDIAYLSLRIALLSVFYKDFMPPLALDDSLTQLDNKRARNALRMLSAYKESGGQSLVFTCHTREKEFLSDICEANIIKL